MTEPTVIYHRQPKTFDPEKNAQLFALVRDGHDLTTACNMVGLAHNTVRDWLLKGGDPASRSRKKCAEHVRVEPYWTFARELREAMTAGRHRVPPGPPRGRRPADITPEQRDAVLRYISQGVAFPIACRDAKLPYATFISWLRLGGYPDPISPYRAVHDLYVEEPYASFVADVQHAEELYFAT